MKCGCGSPGLLFRRNEGNWYCKKCLCRQVEKNFKKELRRDKIHAKKRVFLNQGEAYRPVLLHLLKKLNKKIDFQVVSKKPYDKRFSSFNLDQEASRIIKSWFDKEQKDGGIKPLRFISDKELEIYAEQNGIKFKKRKKDQIERFVDKLEEKKPGTKIQIVKFEEKLKK